MIRFHVDDIKSSHVDKKVNDKFLAWIERTYGKKGKVKSTRGNVHDYLGMIFDYSTKGKVRVDMTKYMKKMVVDLEKKYVLNNTASTPASNDLFGKDEKSPKLDDEMREDFHTFVAKGLFACKRARPDTGTAIAVLSTCLLYTSDAADE